MPVILGSPFFKSCDELSVGRSGTPFDISGEREYLRRFRVVVKFKGMSAISVCMCPLLPIPGSLYVTPSLTEYDTQALAVKFTAKQEFDDEASWDKWIVEVTYSSKLPDKGFPTTPGYGNHTSGQGGAQTNPEQDLPEIEWDYQEVQMSPQYDLDRKAFLNTANKPFSPPPQFPVAYMILSYSRSELKFDPIKGARYANALNSDNFFGFPPQTVQCLPIKAKLKWRGRLSYYSISYKFKFSYIVDNPKDADYQMSHDGQPIGLRKMQPRILSKGMEANPPTAPGGFNPKPKWVNGGRVEMLLDKNGVELQPDAQGKITPYFIEFRMYRTMPFNTLITKGLK